MRREALLFAGSVIVTIALVGIHGTAGLFLFGFAWLILGGDSEVA